MSGSCQGTLLAVLDGSEQYPKGPGRVGGPSQRWVGRFSGRSSRGERSSGRSRRGWGPSQKSLMCRGHSWRYGTGWGPSRKSGTG